MPTSLIAGYLSCLVFLSARSAVAQRAWLPQAVENFLPDRFAERIEPVASPTPSSEEEDRLMAMYAVNNASVVEITGRIDGISYYADVKIEWQTGPNLREYEVTAKCVRQGDGCKGDALGDGAVVVALPKTVEKQTLDVLITDIDVTDETQIDCYISMDVPGGIKNICWDVDVPGRAAPCTGPVQAEGTGWVFSCGRISCDEACAAIDPSLTCNVAGMQAVDSEEKGLFVLGLVNQKATVVFDFPQPDAPVIDYYSPFRSEYYWNGAGGGALATTCSNEGVEPVSQRICCCSSDITDCPTS